MPMRRNAQCVGSKPSSVIVRGMAMVLQCLPEECLGGCNVPRTAEMGFHGAAAFVDGSVQVHPPSTNLYIGLVTAPRPAHWLLIAAPVLSEVGRIPDDPAQNGARGNRDAQLAHDLSQIAIAQFIASS